ncbi:hypothetical protein LWF01_10705 [Saxibacter everestensis]|uniref:Uncharacterized protein n=1 Tax=Saxibacter everestensis TaxID=2909229 RepID=A0ABY8QNX3_9MICO|nr:hypothetical protein LWF01_10705 [Brevibacteriaceae bacterium ZFBP1038]
MVITMNLRKLIDIALCGGIALKEVESEAANLYAWTTAELDLLYVGKAASKKRIEDEKHWVQLDHTRQICSGIVPLLKENQAELHPLCYEHQRFAPRRMLATIQEGGWSGPSIAKTLSRLGDGPAPSVEEVEQVMVRIAVRTGSLIGNAQFASQWEGPIGTFVDTVAALAVDAARSDQIVSSGVPIRPNEDGS